LLLSWKLKEEAARPVVTSPVKNILLFEPKILAPAVVSFLFFSSWAGVAAFFPLYSVECGVANPGYFFAAASVMIILVRVLGVRVFDMYSKEKIIPTFIFVSTIGFVILSFSSTLPMFILVGLLMGASLAFLIPVTMAYALEYAGSSDGSTIGTYQASMDLGLALGPVTMGVIVPITGYRVTFLCLALTSLISLGYFRFYLRKKGRIRV
jgi:MFS family permease